MKKIEITIIDNNNPNYMKRAEQVVKIYNASRLLSERLKLQQPEITRIIHAKGDSGGILLSYHKESATWKIMFAAFDEDRRGKGLLKECLNYAEEDGIDISFVDVSNTEEAAIWRKVGFLKFGTIGFNMTMSNRILEHINYDSFIAFPPS